MDYEGYDGCSELLPSMRCSPRGSQGETMLTYAHNLRHSLALLESLFSAYPCQSTEENLAVLRLARDEFEELNDVYLRITGQRSPYREKEEFYDKQST